MMMYELLSVLFLILSGKWSEVSSVVDSSFLVDWSLVLSWSKYSNVVVYRVPNDFLKLCLPIPGQVMKFSLCMLDLNV